MLLSINIKHFKHMESIKILIGRDQLESFKKAAEYLDANIEVCMEDAGRHNIYILMQAPLMTSIIRTAYLAGFYDSSKIHQEG